MGYRMASPDGAFYLFIQAPNGDDLAFSEMAKEKTSSWSPERASAARAGSGSAIASRTI